MTHKQGLFYCLQFKLRDFCTLASIKRYLLTFFTSFYLHSNSLKSLPVKIYQHLALDGGDSLRGVAILTKIFGVAESWDDFAQFGTNYQCFQAPIHPAFMQRQIFLSEARTRYLLSIVFFTSMVSTHKLSITMGVK